MKLLATSAKYIGAERGLYFLTCQFLLAPPNCMDVSAEHPLAIEEDQWSGHMMKVPLSILTKMCLCLACGTAMGCQES